jgi:predicted RecB family nuclease
MAPALRAAADILARPSGAGRHRDNGLVPERLLTPSKITAWLDCAHYLTLRHEVDSGQRPPEPHRFGDMAQLLVDKGTRHERDVMRRYVVDRRTVVEVAPRGPREAFAAWVGRVTPELRRGHDVLYQMPFVHRGVRGIADFLERVDQPDGSFTYEPVDAKLARSAAKPGHVLQLCFYAEAIEEQLGAGPERLHVELGSGARESLRVQDVLPYWRRLRDRLAALVADPPTAATEPVPCDHCAFCEFARVCDAQWRAADSLVHVAGMRTADRLPLEEAGVGTIATLAALEGSPSVVEIDRARVARLRHQAELQVQARRHPQSPPPFALVAADDADPSEADPSEQGVPQVLTGFAALPEPDEGDVFLDFEGHPFWRADVGLFFLFGLIERLDGQWTYREFWAHDRRQEGAATAALVEHLSARRQRHPGMHVYHYNHTERSALQRLVAEHGVAELELETQVATGLFVDLLPVVTGAVRIGVESYGLKHVEQVTDYQRSHDIDRGSGAVVEYEWWTQDHDATRLQRIARYNEDDVRATLAVRDWLVAHRPSGMPWRDALVEPQTDDPEVDARIERLHAHGPGTPEHLMGDVLGYYRRERRVVAADCLRLSMADAHEQRESPAAVADLSFAGFRDRHSAKTGKKLSAPAAMFTFPEQPVDADISPGSTMIVALDEQRWAFFTVDSIDRVERTLEVAWTPGMVDQGVWPTTLVHYVFYNERAKLDALCHLADRMLAGDATGVGHAILRRDDIRFAGGGPADGQLRGDYAAICRWVPQLDHSYLPVQGPPGTGKTFTGAQVIAALVAQDLRVGVTAMSHAAIDTLMAAVRDRFAADGRPLRAVRKAADGPVAGVRYVDDNARCANGAFDIVAGTPWLFSSTAMRDRPVDVLVVDEAGQLGLADTLAATVSAASVVLLGDPQQLPQVAQASHPNRSGVSALEHLLGSDVRTFPPDRGVLLDVTRRMHPDVCGFISDVMYDGTLRSHSSCAGQRTELGTGLRWVRAEHTGRSTESPEEVQHVQALLRRLLGTRWVDQRGATRVVTPADVIVVTPYNDQRRLLTSVLRDDPSTVSVEVGTVDKFQGREAAVVIFSMATSSAEFLPRGADFLFSKNRLNVAISRARCLAFVVCTDALLDTRARDVGQMTLISAICALVERATPVAAGAHATAH